MSEVPSCCCPDKLLLLQEHKPTEIAKAMMLHECQLNSWLSHELPVQLCSWMQGRMAVAQHSQQGKEDEAEAGIRDIHLLCPGSARPHKFCAQDVQRLG